MNDMQGNVSLSVLESSLNIKRGSDLTSYGERELARASVKYIYTDLCDLQRSYIRFGFHLYEFCRCKYYKDFGYSSFERFCDSNIGLDKSTISRCINVYLRFAKKEEGKYVPSMFIDDKYADYSYSQLCEMVSLGNDDLKHIKPDMTVKQIREYKKSKKETGFKAPAGKSCDVATNEVRFYRKKFEGLKGIVAQNYIKKCVPDNCLICLFDEDGKRIDCNLDVLCLDKDGIVLRRLGEGVK